MNANRELDDDSDKEINGFEITTLFSLKRYKVDVRLVQSNEVVNSSQQY